jgi:hypothetical protein
MKEPIAAAGVVDYRGRTMAQRRAGKTVKVSVSLEMEDLVVLKRHADTSFRGNLSAVFADAAKRLRQKEARARLVEMLGGVALTNEAAAAIDAEIDGVLPSGSRKDRRTSTA